MAPKDALQECAGASEATAASPALLFENVVADGCAPMVREVHKPTAFSLAMQASTSLKVRLIQQRWARIRSSVGKSQPVRLNSV
ncbi:MAG: hypothetical protein WBP94_09720 [Rhodomicrobiaceae bacterium]